MGGAGATGVFVVPGVIDKFLTNPDSDGFAGVLVTTGFEIVAALTGVLDPDSVEEGRGVTDFRAGDAEGPGDDVAALRVDLTSRAEDAAESESALANAGPETTDRPNVAAKTPATSHTYTWKRRRH